MSITISLVVIGTLILLTLLMQYIVKVSTIDEFSDINQLLSVAMIVTDIHIEPLYTSGVGTENNWNSNTIEDWSNIGQLKCSGAKDTPIVLFQSALKDFSKNVPKEQRLFLFSGDNFPYDLNVGKTSGSIEMYKMFDGLLNYFDPSNIFYAVGNNVAKTDNDNVSQVWAQSIVDNHIYKPSGSDDIFWSTGYYKKLIPNTTIYIICFNSILYSGLSSHEGCSGDKCTKKQKQQLDQLKKDLDSLDNKNSVYILTHYPIESSHHSKVSIHNFIWSKIGKKYKDRIRGILIGNTPDKLQNIDSWDYNKDEKAYIWNIPSIYGNKGISSYIKVQLPLNKPLELAETDVMKIRCIEGRSTDSLQWYN